MAVVKLSFKEGKVISDFILITDAWYAGVFL
jgi:hypothetical protein